MGAVVAFANLCSASEAGRKVELYLLLLLAFLLGEVHVRCGLALFHGFLSKNVT